MKTSTLFSTIILAGFMFLANQTNAQKFAKMDASPLDVSVFPSGNRVTDKLVKVVYSRPQLKGRELSQLAPNDKVWRTGANEATNMIIYKDIKIGGKSVKAGEYSLFTIPGANEWTIILNKDINVWGAYSYNEANDVIRVSAPVSMGDESLEAFSIAFDDAGTMYLGWDKTRVAVPIAQ